MQRTILHCDLNSFFASVELILNPSLRGKPMAVCGSREERHGIVLAKTDSAKKAGVQTGEAIWQAQQKCPELVIAKPHYDEYMKYSFLFRSICSSYTDLIEPFGIDECWLDTTGSRRLFGDGRDIAEILRERMKRETGLSISVGVSFNKIFAKLGSDMKKPDATTVIPYEGFREQLYPLPASDMLGVGRAMTSSLARLGITTIGELATADVDFLVRRFGKCGRQLWLYANGEDNSPVNPQNYSAPIKSVGHGSTGIADLASEREVRRSITELSQDVGYRLRKHALMACGVQLAVKDSELSVRQYQCPLDMPTQSFMEISQAAFRLFKSNYDWHSDVRAVTVRAINLINAAAPIQLSMSVDYERHLKQDSLELAIGRIRSRFGKNAVNVG